MPEMIDPSSDPTPDQPKSLQDHWAAPVSRLNVTGIPASAVNLNVAGRHVTSPVSGFGQMWQKTYQIRFTGAQVPPKEVVRVWKDKFASFWPKNNYFYGNSGTIRPGDVAVLNLAGPGGMTVPGGAPMISTGIVVIYVDDESFSFLTPEGHMFAAIITFSAFEEAGSTVAQIQALVRGSDPLYELVLRIGLGHKMEDDFWKATLQNLAASFGAQGTPTLNKQCVDARLQWSEAKNIWHNAGIRTTFYTLGTPFRWVGRKLNRRQM
jgi:hypothetical protein